MTPQEEAMLNDLIGRVQQTQLTEKDPEADQLLAQTLGRNPNALYVLAQTVLVQKYALDQASAQISQLRQAPPQPAHTTSFLGNLLGHREPAPPPPPPGYGAPPNQAWNQVPAYGQPSMMGSPLGSSMGGGGFLRSAATTAAGVAAGALAFEGVESLLHGFGHSSGFGGGGYFGGGAPEEIITNNYYDVANRGSSEGHHERSEPGNFADTGDAGNLQQASDDLRDDSGDATLDDVSYDDSSTGDSGSFDDQV